MLKQSGPPFTGIVSIIVIPFIIPLILCKSIYNIYKFVKNKKRFENNSIKEKPIDKNPAWTLSKAKKSKQIFFYNLKKFRKIEIFFLQIK